jgi:hypothetical protein
MLESNSDTTKYWSFNYGNVHFLSYSFEVLEGFDNNPHFGAQVRFSKILISDETT